MEELSIEEKAKRYDEAIKRIEDIKTGKCETTFMFSEGLFEHIFPEHVESKDEKIRKAIYNCVEWFGFDSSVFKDVSQEECLAWIDKQGENNMGISEATKQKLEDNLNKALEKETPESWNGFLEGQGEQKPITYHKFKVGDEIKTSKEESLIITKIDDKGYWSEDLFICDFDEECVWDLVEQKHVWSEEDEKALDSMLNDIKQGVIPDNDDINWLKTFKERVQLQPQTKQEWSDEDERARLTTEFVLMKNFGVGTPLVDWLRKLKDRATVLIN